MTGYLHPSHTEFQFTPLREGRHLAGCQNLVLRNHFNSRPSARGDADARRKVLDKKNFNSRPSARGDDARLRWTTLYKISIHAPPRGATRLLDATAAAPIHFNSRPSARGDFCWAKMARRFVISIHAPPRGATRIVGICFSHCAISIHAPPRGATANVQPLFFGDKFQFTPLREGRHAAEWLPTYKSEDFNSRPSARGDVSTVVPASCAVSISIHAPPRGATV